MLARSSLRFRYGAPLRRFRSILSSISSYRYSRCRDRSKAIWSRSSMLTRISNGRNQVSQSLSPVLNSRKSCKALKRPNCRNGRGGSEWKERSFAASILYVWSSLRAADVFFAWDECVVGLAFIIPIDATCGFVFRRLRTSAKKKDHSVAKFVHYEV